MLPPGQKAYCYRAERAPLGHAGAAGCRAGWAGYGWAGTDREVFVAADWEGEDGAHLQAFGYEGEVRPTITYPCPLLSPCVYHAYSTIKPSMLPMYVLPCLCALCYATQLTSRCGKTALRGEFWSAVVSSTRRPSSPARARSRPPRRRGPPRPTPAGRRPARRGGLTRVRSHSRFRHRGTESRSASGMKRMSGGTKRQYGRTLDPAVASPTPPARDRPRAPGRGIGRGTGPRPSP